MTRVPSYGRNRPRLRSISGSGSEPAHGSVPNAAAGDAPETPGTSARGSASFGGNLG